MNALRAAVEDISKRWQYEVFNNESQGGFCKAFKVKSRSGDIKCWRVWMDSNNIKESKYKTRYELIGSDGGVDELSYFLKFSYFEDAMVLKGDNGKLVKLPLLEMDWVIGEHLFSFMDGKWKDMEKRQQLEFIRGFYIMCFTMRNKGIAHGDLSCLNIRVTYNDKSELKLIDYDSIYVPSMGNNKFHQVTRGTASFQHPGRITPEGVLYASKNDDNFSQIVIALSLWMAYFDIRVIDDLYCEDNLLFQHSDFIGLDKFHKSIAWTDYIVKYKDKYPHFDTLVGLLERSIQGRVNEVPSLLDYVKGDVIHSKERFAQLAEVYKMNVIPQSVSAPAVKMAKYCTYCGKEFEIDADKFCDSCGKQREVCYS